MQHFTTAAVHSMGQSNPGLGGFMNMMGGQGQPQQPQQSQQPQQPQQPQQQSQSRSMPQQPQFSQQSRGAPPPPMATQGPVATPPPVRPGYVPLPNRPDINASRNIPAQERSSRRPEMKGPSDISNLLSGLKVNKTAVDIQNDNDDKGSTISITELKEMQNDNIPVRSKRRKSERNTVSLDI